MKKYLAIVLAIAILLAPIYVLNASAVDDARSGFAVTDAPWRAADSISQVEAGIQFTHYFGIWMGQGQDQIGALTFPNKIDPTKFEMKYTINKLADRLKKVMMPWGNVYDSWINISIMDTKRSFDTNSNTSHGIVLMERIWSGNGPDDYNLAYQGFLLDATTATDWQTIYGDQMDSWADVDPLGQTFDTTFTRLDNGTWEYKVNDVVVTPKSGLDWKKVDAAFLKGTQKYTPQTIRSGQVDVPDLNLFTYEVKSADAVKVAGQPYVPAVTAFAKYVGAELEFYGAVSAKDPVPAVTEYATGKFHPAVSAIAEVTDPGKPYVAPVTYAPAAYGPELTIVPKSDAVPAVTAAAAGWRTKMTNLPGVTGAIPASQKVTFDFIADKDSNGKVVPKDMYFQTVLSSSVKEEMQITVSSFMGQSLFVDKTAPIIVCPANGGYYNDPVIDAYEQGEGKITEMWYAPNKDGSSNASAVENGTQLTTEGDGWLKVKNGIDSLSAYSVFVIDHTAPVISGANAGATVTGPVTITVTDANLASVRAISPSGKTITWPSTNTFKAKSSYKIVAVDKAGNISQLAFTIK